MKIGCSLYSFHKSLADKTIKLDDKSIWEEYRKNGIEGVELWVPPLESLNWDDAKPMRALQKTLQNYGIEIFSFCVESGILINQVLPYHAPYEKWLESVKQINLDRAEYARFWLNIAAEIGVPNMRFCYGPGFYGYKVTASEIVGFNADRAAELYEPLCMDAKNAGVRIGFENHGFITSDLKFLQVILKKAPNVFVCLDLGNLPDNRWPYIEEVVKKNRVLYVHAKTNGFDKNGEDTWVDYGRAMQILKDGGFNGWYSIEWEGGSLSEPEGVAKSSALLKKYRY